MVPSSMISLIYLNWTIVTRHPSLGTQCGYSQISGKGSARLPKKKQLGNPHLEHPKRRKPRFPQD